MPNAVTRIAVTGDRRQSNLPVVLSDGTKVEWVSIPVLEYELLNLSAQVVGAIEAGSYDWVVLASARAVQYYFEATKNLKSSIDSKPRYAAVGQRTAKLVTCLSKQDCLTPDGVGSEAFLEAFNRLEGTFSILLPVAVGGRDLIASQLTQAGHQVTVAPLYQSKPCSNLPKAIGFDQPAQALLADCSAILFTSPSSVDGFLKHFELNPRLKIACLGDYTAQHLKSLGLANKVLPKGDYARMNEILELK